MRFCILNGVGLAQGAGGLFLFLCLDLLKTETPKPAWRRGWRENKSVSPSQTRSRSTGRCVRPCLWLSSASRGQSQGSTGPSLPPVGPTHPGMPGAAGCPTARKASVTITTAALARPLSAAAEQATATSPGSPLPRLLCPQRDRGQWRPPAGPSVRQPPSALQRSGAASAADRQRGERAEISGICFYLF